MTLLELSRQGANTPFGITGKGEQGVARLGSEAPRSGPLPLLSRRWLKSLSISGVSIEQSFQKNGNGAENENQALSPEPCGVSENRNDPAKPLGQPCERSSSETVMLHLMPSGGRKKNLKRSRPGAGFKTGDFVQEKLGGGLPSNNSFLTAFL